MFLVIKSVLAKGSVMLRFPFSKARIAIFVLTLSADLLSQSRAHACTMVWSPPLPRLAGETDAQYRVRDAAHVAQQQRAEAAANARMETERQAQLWRTAEQIVLVNDAPIELAPVNSSPTIVQRAPKRVSLAKRGPIPPPPLVQIPLVIADPNRVTRVLVVRSWLKGAGSNKRLNFSSGRNTCGSFSGPAGTQGPLLLFAPRGPIRERSLLDYIEVDKIVDPDIAAALRRAHARRRH
jgi:hypothetical protein